MFEKKILITGTVTGLLLFGLTLYMTVSTPNVPIRSNHSGFTSTIIALELAQTKEQIKDIVGGPEDENHYEYLNRFKFSLKLDFLYIFLYIFYFLLLFEVCARENRYEIPLRITLYVLLVIAFVCDFLENKKLFGILEARSEEETIQHLENLREFSLVKWESVFICSSLCGFLFYLSEKSNILRISGFILFPPAFVFILTFQNLRLVEISALIMSVGLLVSYSYFVTHLYLSFRKKT